MSTIESRHTTTTDEIAAVRAAFDLGTDIHIDITKTGWENATCDITGAPAAVDVRFVDKEDGLTSLQLAADQVTEQLDALTLRDNVDHTEPITLDVSYWWLRYVANVAAAA